MPQCLLQFWVNVGCDDEDCISPKRLRYDQILQISCFLCWFHWLRLRVAASQRLIGEQAVMWGGERYKWNMQWRGEGSDVWSNLESDGSRSHLLNQSDVCGRKTISCFRLGGIRPPCGSATLRCRSDRAFKNHWVENDVHYLAGGGKPYWSVQSRYEAEWGLNQPSSFTALGWLLCLSMSIVLCFSSRLPQSSLV